MFGAKAQPASFLGDFCNKIGTKRTYRDDLLVVRFRATAVRHARVASTASVVNDPSRHLTINFVVLHNAAPS